MAENLALRAANLYGEGLSFDKIGKELEISRSRVGNLIRDVLNSMEKQDEGSDKDTLDSSDDELENKDEFSTIDFNDNRDLDELMNKTILIHAAPILRKVALNSKVFLQHEYFQEKLGYEGDIGDLLVEALDFYWKEMGFTIKISQDTVM